MGAHLHCIAGAYEGRRLVLYPDRPLELPLKHRGAIEGTLRVEALADNWQLAVDGTVPVEVNGEQVVEQLLAEGDLIKVGKMTFEMVFDEEEQLPDHHPGRGDTVVLKVPGQRNLKPESDRDEQTSGGRSRRKISAARMSPVDQSAPSKDGLLKKVSQVFRRDARKGQLDDLLDQRDALLAEVGRAGLERQGAVGLPEDLLSRLAAGESVTLALGGLAAGDLELHRKNRQLLSSLDAEIEALRHELGLDARYGEALPVSRSRSDLQEAEDRAHEAMDGINTEPLDADLDDEVVAEPIDDADISSAARRRRRRRRR